MPKELPPIDFDQVYYANSYGGAYKIIKDLGCDAKGNRKVIIHFILDDFEKEVYYNSAIKGAVKDEIFNINFDKPYYSLYYGPYTILSYEGKNEKGLQLVKIRFEISRNEYVVTYKSIFENKAYDRDVPRDALIPTIEMTPPAIYTRLIDLNLKRRWEDMMDRCYNINAPNYSLYGGQGVRVIPFWHDLNTFLNTVREVKQFNKYFYYPSNYSIDKDYLQQNVPKDKRFYSPITCIFLSNADNANMAAIEKGWNQRYFGIVEYTSKRANEQRYVVSFRAKGKERYFGAYSNLAAALAVYKHWYMIYADYELIPLFNKNTGVPYMSFEEAQKYLVEK